MPHGSWALRDPPRVFASITCWSGWIEDSGSGPSPLIPLQSAIQAHQKKLKACTACPQMLGPVVIGNPIVSPIILVGQAPGDKEGPAGKPFAWTAGKTLFSSWINGKWTSSPCPIPPGPPPGTERNREKPCWASLCNRSRITRPGAVSGIFKNSDYPSIHAASSAVLIRHSVLS